MKFMIERKKDEKRRRLNRPSFDRNTFNFKAQIVKHFLFVLYVIVVSTRNQLLVFKILKYSVHESYLLLLLSLLLLTL